MIKNYDAIPPYIQADANKVLCNGSTYTGPGGRVYLFDKADADHWTEMTEAEAEALTAIDEDISDEELGAMVREVL